MLIGLVLLVSTLFELSISANFTGTCPKIENKIDRTVIDSFIGVKAKAVLTPQIEEVVRGYNQIYSKNFSNYAIQIEKGKKHVLCFKKYQLMLYEDNINTTSMNWTRSVLPIAVFKKKYLMVYNYYQDYTTCHINVWILSKKNKLNLTEINSIFKPDFEQLKVKANELVGYEGSAVPFCDGFEPTLQYHRYYWYFGFLAFAFVPLIIHLATRFYMRRRDALIAPNT